MLCKELTTWPMLSIFCTGQAPDETETLFWCRDRHSLAKRSAASPNLNSPNPCTASEDEVGVGGTGEGKPHAEGKQTHGGVGLSSLSCVYRATGSLYLFQLWISLSSDFYCCRSCPCFLLLNAIKHNVLLLCKHFKLLHIWFWMFDRFILNINVFYEITVWKCFFANHCVSCEQNLNPGLKCTNHSFNFVLGCLKSLWEIKNKFTNISAYGPPRG